MSSSGTATIWTLSMVVYSSSGVASMTVPISGAILIKVSCFDMCHTRPSMWALYRKQAHVDTESLLQCKITCNCERNCCLVPRLTTGAVRGLWLRCAILSVLPGSQTRARELVLRLEYGRLALAVGNESQHNSLTKRSWQNQLNLNTSSFGLKPICVLTSENQPPGKPNQLFVTDIYTDIQTDRQTDKRSTVTLIRMHAKG